MEIVFIKFIYCKKIAVRDYMKRQQASFEYKKESRMNKSQYKLEKKMWKKPCNTFIDD